MKTKKLSKRLSACLDALFPLKRIADIGTDHAYLPCHGIATTALDSAIAIDVIDGPLMQAKATIKAYGFQEQIELRKGSGLEPLVAGEVEGAVIAGMGGKLIAQLITDSLSVAKSMKKMVLQPQSGEYTLRRSLFKQGFTIINEELLEEDGIIYTVITIQPGKQAFDEIDCLFGPILKKEPASRHFITKWQRELMAIDEILDKVPVGNPKRDAFEAKKRQIEEVLTHVTDERCD